VPNVMQHNAVVPNVMQHNAVVPNVMQHNAVVPNVMQHNQCSADLKYTEVIVSIRHVSMYRLGDTQAYIER